MTPPGAFILGCAGPALDPSERAFFAEAQPWGFILFARNVESPAQLQRLTTALRDAVGREAPVLIDQEGGRVQRMGPPYWRQWLPPLDQMAAAPDLDAAARGMFLRYRLIAAELRASGIDTNCAPLADIAGAATHPFLRNRCFGEDAATVITGARACAEGLLAGGVLPVIKHLPGHGRARTDSHASLPVVDAPAAVLAAEDFEPFRALSDLPLGMSAHIDFTALAPGVPATQSPEVIGAIRQQIGFGGLLMTDDISMNALSGTVAERSAVALAAGCDVVLHCNGDLPEMQAVAGACPALAGKALERADAALAVRRPPEPLDIPAAERELRDLLEGELHGQG